MTSGYQSQEETTRADLGQAALQTIFKDLQIDEKWSTHRDRAFTWIAHRMEQTITVSRPIQDDEVSLYLLTAETVVVNGVGALEPVVEQTLSDVNRFAFGSCYSYDKSKRCIVATTRCWVHEGTKDWRTPIFGMYAIGQLCFAETEADYLADRFRGSVAVCVHPQSGLRQVADDMLNAVDELFAPAGLEASRYRNEFEFDTVADAAKLSAFAATLGATADGIALECSFDDYTAIAIVSSEAKHRRLGAGLSVRLHLPMEITDQDGARIAAALNRYERDDAPEPHHTGAWCVDIGPLGNRAVTYRSFMPNCMYQSGLILDVSTACVARMRWADRKLNGQPTHDNAWNRLAKRFGVGGE
jgi:hypothetical protein